MSQSDNGQAKTLLLSKFVNRFFQGTIEGSQKLQAALFTGQPSTPLSVLEINPIFTAAPMLKGPFPFTSYSICPTPQVVEITLAPAAFSLLGKGYSWEGMQLIRSNSDMVTSYVLRSKELFGHYFSISTAEYTTMKEFLGMVQERFEEVRQQRKKAFGLRKGW